MKKAIYLVLFLVSLCLVTFSQPSPNRVGAAGLKEEVTVRRDDRWIPYIDAKSDHDVYFAQGYITASDRLWQMDLMRRLARGATAELFGSRTLDQDKRWRRFGFSAIAEN